MACSRVDSNNIQVLSFGPIHDHFVHLRLIYPLVTCNYQYTLVDGEVFTKFLSILVTWHRKIVFHGDMITGRGTLTHTGVVSHQQDINDEDIPELCERTASLQPEIKWSCHLITTTPMNPRDPMVPVPYSLGAVEALCSYWNVPYNYVPRFEAINTCSATFPPIIGDEVWKGLVIYFHANTTLITYDSANHRTFGICLSDYDAKRIQRRIERLPNFAFSPLFAPVAIAGMAVHEMVGASSTSYAAGSQIEDTLGYWSSESDNRMEKDLNFTQMIQSLNILSVRLANTELMQAKTISGLNFLNEQLLAWPKEPGALISIELQEQTRWLRQLTLDWMMASKRTKDSVQSLTQTMYATLQQRDNQLNHRYGADMRLITAITLIFLPGTFVATFFSTTFWDFSPDNRGAKVTYWVYLYFVVTIGLTFLVLLAWRKFSVLKRLAANMGQVVHRIPLLGSLMKKKRGDDEELGKKGD